MHITYSPDVVDHDWKQTGRCADCGGTIWTMRRNGDWARQEEHTPRHRREMWEQRQQAKRQ